MYYFNDIVAGKVSSVTSFEAATLNLPTGQIVACDPLTYYEAYNSKPFVATVVPGSYPVKLWTDKTGLIGLAAVVIKAKAKVVSWEEAFKAEDGQTACYPVDAGIGCFMDLETQSLLEKANQEFYKSNPDLNYYTDVIELEMKAQQNKDYLNHFPCKDDPKHNVTMFSSAHSDGVYTTYIGRDKKGEIVCFLTDFEAFKDLVKSKPEKSIQTFKVRLLNPEEGLDTTIEVPSKKNIVAAAKKSGINLPATCCVGACTSCAAKLLEGEVDQSEQGFLDDEQLADGWVLTCVARPKSDCTVLVNQEKALK